MPQTRCNVTVNKPFFSRWEKESAKYTYLACECKQYNEFRQSVC
ncbi:hypothetical protein GPUN_1544 [Glaciecola punicea ACAM 611]|uniref:Uncharacterized protein n=1 Tax=Glaciecola punicea ACAM 611 TaxID=1121923 RepID=H5TBI7_9ALTE|nr:hypothetical protein GPUN_1544 [Glaciecola punicea ACAM 611]